MTYRDVLKRVDHTLLKQPSTWEQIREICDDAVKFGTASVCIPPSFVKQASEYLGEKMPVCTVIGFPNGYNTTAVKVFETKEALKDGAEEIDMVINIGWVKMGQYDKILEEINATRPLHIITLEDPIEYVYTPKCAIVNQREVGADVEDYETGLYASLREDPDVILIGEMRTPETIETALTAAETGHLVFSTIHTNSAVDSIDRIVGVFPENKQPQIRLQLSMTLKAVLSQQLVPLASGHGRTVACELMMITTAIRNLIRDGKTPQMASFLLSGAKDGSVTMDHSLANLARQGIIMPETALEVSEHPEDVRKQMNIRGNF